MPPDSLPCSETAELSRPDRNALDRRMIKQLRERAAGYRHQATFAQALIFLSIIGGLWLFGSAGQIAIAEANSREAIRISQGTAQRSNLGTLRLELERTKSELARLQDAKPPLDSAQRRREEEPLVARAQKLDREIDRLERDLSRDESMTQSPKVGDAVDSTVSVLTTRIGSILLILFLVQVLVSLYRYATRMSAHHDTRADALEMLPDADLSSFSSLVVVLSPEKVDFAQLTDTPLTSLIDLAKSVASSKSASAKSAP